MNYINVKIIEIIYAYSTNKSTNQQKITLVLNVPFVNKIFSLVLRWGLKSTTIESILC